jgi:hypothetical protein
VLKELRHVLEGLAALGEVAGVLVASYFVLHDFRHAAS